MKEGINMQIDKIIIAVLALIAILAMLLVGAGICGLCMFANNIQTGGYMSPVEHREDKTTHDGAAKVSIEADTFGGNVEISESTTDKIEVIYDAYASAGHLNDIVTGTNYSMEGDTLKITAITKIRENANMVTGRLGAHINIKVPKNASYSFNLNTAGGNIIVTELNGSRLKAATAGGNIDFSGGKYDTIIVNTAGGNVHATYDANTATFQTLGGNIYITSKQTAGTLNLNTAGGNVAVRLPQGTQFTVDATTMGGKVTHGSIPLVTTDESRSKLTGHTEGGAGALSIDLRSMGGNIEISY